MTLTTYKQLYFTWYFGKCHSITGHGHAVGDPLSRYYLTKKMDNVLYLMLRRHFTPTELFFV